MTTPIKPGDLNGLRKVMSVQGPDGKAHPIYGDDFVAFMLQDVLNKVVDLEMELAKLKGTVQ